MRTARALGFSLLSLLASISVGACHTASVPPSHGGAASASVDARVQALRNLIAEQWEHTLRSNPELATQLGDNRYNDRWDDFSEQAIRADLDATKSFLARLDAIDVTGMPENDRLNHALLRRKLALDVEGARFEDWLMPVNQFWGIHTMMPQMVSITPLSSVKDYDAYLARLRAIPTVLDQAMDLMRAGMAKGLVPPKILLGQVAEQADAIAQPAPEENVFASPLKKFPDAVGESDRARIRAACLAAVEHQIAPAYRKFSAFVRVEYEPRGRVDPGIWALPDGEARYAFAIKQTTSTTLGADAIHETGLREVARIEGEMRKVAKKLGYDDLHAMADAIRSKPELHFGSRQAVVDLYRKYTAAMEPKLPSLFGRLPRAKLEIMPIEEFREKGSAGAEYTPSSEDGSRPGHVMVNTGDFAKRTTTDVETTAYHEGVPGHHLQIAIAQELPELPAFRRNYFVTAYVEGWALYAERLGEEVGMYDDPYSYYGHLQDEMLRAIRLVADTGLHAKRWTRQQVVDFFHAHSTNDEVGVQAETNRYIAIPSQALAYKIGQLRILAIREKAKSALGAKFDIRGFHDVVLGSGALPLDVLESEVDRWIDTKKKS